MRASELKVGHIGKSNIGTAIIFITEDKDAVFVNCVNAGGIEKAENLNDDYEDMGKFYIDIDFGIIKNVPKLVGKC